MNNDASKVINGTYGTLWVDGEVWAEVDSFTATVTPVYEAVNFANDGAEHQKLVGWTGAGSFTLKKVYSRMQRKVAAGVKKGILPYSTLVGKLADPSAWGTERTVLSGVTFDSFNLMAFEQKTVMTEDVAFKFSDYDMPDVI